MVRNLCVGTAGMLWFACAASAQPLCVPAETAPVTVTIEAEATAAAVTENGAPDQEPACSFEQLKQRLAGGDLVYVVDAAGNDVRGRVAMLSEAVLILMIDGARREFAADAVTRIERRQRDSVRNGLIIGAVAGGLLGFSVGRAADSPTCPRSGAECGQGAIVGTVGGALWGALGGWITDVLIRRREVIYLAHGAR